MTLEEQLEVLRAKGFAEDQAEVIVAMREAALVIFSAFPDSFILIGGANLLLFQESVRLSTDLDLFPRDAKLPTADQVMATLSEGLKLLARLMKMEGLRVENLDAEGRLVRLAVFDDKKRLFTIDFSRIGQVIEAGTEEHFLESVSEDKVVKIIASSREHQLLQKAETFLFRTRIKARDAYDIFVLTEKGATLTDNLKYHLTDALNARDIEGNQIRDRIEFLQPRHFRAELEGYLPDSVYKPLAEEGFGSLKAALEQVFADYLGGR